MTFWEETLSDFRWLLRSFEVIPGIVLCPLERVKILLQTQPELIKCGYLKEPFHGILDCTKKIIKEEGFLNLWKGAVYYMLRLSYLPVGFPTTSKLHFIVEEVESVTLQKFLYSLVKSYPLEFIYTRWMADFPHKSGEQPYRFESLSDLLSLTWFSSMFTAMWRGITFSVIEWVVFAFTRDYFAYFAHNLVVNSVNTSTLLGKILKTLCVEILPPIVATVAAYPFDTVRRRMMITITEDAKYKYTTGITAMVDIVRNEGISALYSGLPLAIIMAFAPFAKHKMIFPLIFPQRRIPEFPKFSSVERTIPSKDLDFIGTMR